MSKKLQGISNQICLYAKGWYGRGRENIKDDIKTLIAHYSEIEPDCIPDCMIMEYLCDTFSQCVTKQWDVKDTLMEITRTKYDRLNRESEEVLIGKISIVDGDYVDMRKKMDFSLGKTK